MNTTSRKRISDVDIKNSVLSEIKFEPSVKTTDIGVLVKDGTVTLTGSVSTYIEKINAVRATSRVAGVNGIADEIEIKFAGSHARDDGDIAAAATQQIKWSGMVPNEAVKVTVRDGWITLDGTVEWWYEKDATERCVQHLLGVKGVTNNVAITPKVTAVSIEQDIQSAFKRSAMLDADEVAVTTSGSKVTLLGKVRTYAEKNEAERVAWAAPGVRSVDNGLTVNWSWLSD